jgi:hypothetical protein
MKKKKKKKKNKTKKICSTLEIYGKDNQVNDVMSYVVENLYEYKYLDFLKIVPNPHKFGNSSDWSYKHLTKIWTAYVKDNPKQNWSEFEPKIIPFPDSIKKLVRRFPDVVIIYCMSFYETPDDPYKKFIIKEDGAGIEIPPTSMENEYDYMHLVELLCTV